MFAVDDEYWEVRTGGTCAGWGVVPYGVAKALGGDSAANDAWMERCVQAVQAKHGFSKVSAIRICKAQQAKRKAKA